MPSVQYTIKSDKLQSPFTVGQIKSQYTFGIDLVDSLGNAMSDEAIQSHIDRAIAMMEGYLNLKLRKQIITETFNFVGSDWRQWGIVPTSFPIVKAFSLSGFLGKVEQISFPGEWVSTQRSTDGIYQRHFTIVPTTNSTTTNNSLVYSGVYPHLGHFSSRTVPNYWSLQYCTSFDGAIPADILEAIGMLSTMSLFDIFGDLLLTPGIASQSISLDGLSQSLGTTQSAENAALSARIRSYERRLNGKEGLLRKLKNKYDGIGFDVL